MEAACLGAESQKSAIDRGRLWRKGNYVFVRVRVERGRVGETSDTRGGAKEARRSGERPQWPDYPPSWVRTDPGTAAQVAC